MHIYRRIGIAFITFLIVHFIQAQTKLYPVKKNNLIGFIDVNNKLVLPYQYISYNNMDNGMIKLWDGKKLIIYSDGKSLELPTGINNVTYLDPKHLILYNNNYCFLANEKLTLINPDSFLIITKAKDANDYFLFSKYGENGILNKRGKIIAKFPNLMPKFVGSHNFYVKQNKQLYFYDTNFKLIIQDSFNSVKIIDRKNKLFAGSYTYTGALLFKENGEKLFPFPKDVRIEPFSNAFLVCNSKKYNDRLYDLNKNKFIDIPFKRAFQSDWDDCILLENKDNKKYYYSRNFGNSPSFLNIIETANFAIVSSNKKWGIMDTKFQAIMIPQYKKIDTFFNNLVKVLQADSGYKLFNIATKQFVTTDFYKFIIREQNVVKCYGFKLDLDMYDIENNSLTNKQHFNNVSRIETDIVDVDFTPIARTFTVKDTNAYWQKILIGKNTKFGLFHLDSNRRISDTVISAQFDNIIFKNNIYAIGLKRISFIYKEKNQIMYAKFLIDIKKRKVLDTAFDYVEFLNLESNSDDKFIIAIKLNTKYILINKNNWKFSEEYAFISPYYDGKWISAIKYGKWNPSNLQNFYRGTILKNQDISGHYQLINYNGEKVFPIKYNDTHFSNIYALNSNRYSIENTDGFMWVMDSNFREITPRNTYYDLSVYLKDYYLCSKSKTNKGFYNSKENKLFTENVVYNDLIKTLIKTELGTASIFNNGQWKKIDSKNQYFAISNNFIEKNGKKYQILNSNLELIKVLDIDSLISIDFDKAIVFKNKFFGILNANGMWICNANLNKVPKLFQTAYSYINNNKYYISNVTTNFQFNLEKYTIHSEPYPGIFKLKNKSNNLIAYCNDSGKIITPDCHSENMYIFEHFLLFNYFSKAYSINLKTKKINQSNELWKINLFKDPLIHFQIRNNIIDMPNSLRTIHNELYGFKPVLTYNNASIIQRVNSPLYQNIFQIETMDASASYASFYWNIRYLDFTNFNNLGKMKLVKNNNLFILNHDTYAEYNLNSEHGNKIFHIDYHNITALNNNWFELTMFSTQTLYDQNGKILKDNFYEIENNSGNQCIIHYSDHSEIYKLP